MARSLPALRLAAMSEPVIIGGGPAGTAAAIAIARAGLPVTLIERHATSTPKVCGDFLSTEAVTALTSLGVDLSQASWIDTVRLVHRDRVATARLPFIGRGMTRCALDEALLQLTQASGATVLRGRRIHAIERQGSAFHLEYRNGAPIVADTVFLATGKHELRGATRPTSTRSVVGCKMYLTLAPAQLDALRRSVELVLFPGGYAGLQLVEADRAVLCALLPAAYLRSHGNHWQGLLGLLTEQSPQLRQRLAGAHALLDRPLAISGLPFGYLHRPGLRDPPNLYRLGDQATVIASLTGDGIALALASGMQAARTWLAGGNAATYHHQFASGMSRRISLATALHRLCLTPAMQPWLVAACSTWPGALRLAAAATRHTFDV